MFPIFYKLSMLAQAFDDLNDPADPPPQETHTAHRMSFSDLQKSIHDVHTGQTNDSYFQYLLLGMVACVALIALVLHLRQRHKEAGPLNNPRKLARELTRRIRFPLGTRLLLKWVAKSTRMPVATLLLSARAFDNAIAEWCACPTFSVLRRWGSGRLQLLKPILFDPTPLAAALPASEKLPLQK